MVLKQYYLGCLAHASYLVGDGQARAAVVVDPQRDVEQYLEDARALGLEIRHVFLTHFHADFVAGHLELRDRTRAMIHLGSKAEAEYPFVAMKDGEVLDLGRTRLQVLHTPGHTPESISILLFDLDQDATKPQAVLTGDTLFVGDVGRPDLRMALGWSADELGRMLYDSLHEKLLRLPDETRVFPAHGAGSLCGKQLGSENSTTIGEQRRFNYALQPMSKEEFVRMVLAEQPDAPPYFTYDAVLNTKERLTLDASLARSLKPLTPDALLALQASGGQILDVRDPAYFAAVHLAGSISIPLRGQYATWAGTILSREKPIGIIAEPGREHEAAMRLGRIGFDHVAGYLDGGMEALRSRPALVRHAERVNATRLAAELDSPRPPWVLDVRTPRERAEKRIPGTAHIPLDHLVERLAEVPGDRRIVVHCASGYRSSIAASLLRKTGFGDVADVSGGMAAWEAAKSSVPASRP